MPFALFLLVNAVLIVRPTEVITGLAGLQIYNVVILAAVAASAGRILALLTGPALTASPVTVCVLGCLVAIVLSHLARGQADAAIAGGMMFLKLVLYYLLVVANLRSPWHLRAFLVAVCGLMSVQVGLGVLQYYGHIDLESLRPHQDTEFDSVTGEAYKGTPRLCGAGIFHDPNDLCVLMVMGVLIALYLVRERTLGPARFLAVGPLVVFLVGIPLTGSRGGMLALMGAFATLLFQLLGNRRGLLLVGAAVPVLLVTVGGRMTRFDLGNPNDTGQARMRHWSDGLLAVRDSPVFGIGQGQYEELATCVAHNSYIEAYTELGLFGGTLFTGAFAYSAWVLVRLGRRPTPGCPPALARARPFLLATVVALVAGMASLSRGYSPMTYLLLGTVAAYFRLTARYAPRAVPRVRTDLVVCWTGLSVLFLAAMSVVVPRMILWQ